MPPPSSPLLLPPPPNLPLAPLHVRRCIAPGEKHRRPGARRLATVYNMLGSNGAARYNTFLAMVTFAGDAGKECLSAVSPECEGLEGKLAEWGTDAAKSRALYTAIFTAMGKHGDR